MKREYGDYIEDIIDSMTKAEDFIGNMTKKDFLEDEKTIFATIKVLEVIGEAVKNIPASIRKQYPEIPRRDMAGMRNKLIHEYFGVKLDLVWKTVKQKIPLLKPIFQNMLQDLEKKRKIS